MSWLSTLTPAMSCPEPNKHMSFTSHTPRRNGVTEWHVLQNIVSLLHECGNLGLKLPDLLPSALLIGIIEVLRGDWVSLPQKVQVRVVPGKQTRSATKVSCTWHADPLDMRSGHRQRHHTSGKQQYRPKKDTWISKRLQNKNCQMPTSQ